MQFTANAVDFLWSSCAARSFNYPKIVLVVFQFRHIGFFDLDTRTRKTEQQQLSNFTAHGNFEDELVSDKITSVFIVALLSQRWQLLSILSFWLDNLIHLTIHVVYFIHSYIISAKKIRAYTCSK